MKRTPKEINELIDQFLVSGISVLDFNKAHNLCNDYLNRWAKKLGRVEEYKNITRKSHLFSIEKRIGRGKWNPVSDGVKQKAMADFLSGMGTTKEIARKYGFNERRLRGWFEKDGKLIEFERRAKENIISKARVPMRIMAKLKISGANNLAYIDGLHYEVKKSYVRAVRDRSRGDKYEHRLILEKIIGRALSVDEVVHHINLNPTDNRPENLIVATSKEHGLLHIFLQLALVQLLSENDLRDLTHQLIDNVKQEIIRRNGGES